MNYKFEHSCCYLLVEFVFALALLLSACGEHEGSCDNCFHFPGVVVEIPGNDILDYVPVGAFMYSDSLSLTTITYTRHDGDSDYRYLQNEQALLVESRSLCQPEHDGEFYLFREIRFNDEVLTTNILFVDLDAKSRNPMLSTYVEYRYIETSPSGSNLVIIGKLLEGFDYLDVYNWTNGLRNIRIDDSKLY